MLNGAPSVVLREKDADREVGACEVKMGVDFAFKCAVAFDGPKRERVEIQIDNGETGAGKERERLFNGPRPTVEIKIRRSGIGGEDDDGIIDSVIAINEVAMDAAGGVDGFGEVGGKKVPYRRAGDADDGDGTGTGRGREDGLIWCWQRHGALGEIIFSGLFYG